MANNMNTFLENKLLEHSLGKTAYTMPTVFLALFSTDPTSTGSAGTEISGGGYARQPITCGSASGGSISNSADINFGTASAAWGTVAYVGIVDAVSGAFNMLYHSALASSKTINSGDSFKVASGQLSLSIS